MIAGLVAVVSHETRGTATVETPPSIVEPVVKVTVNPSYVLVLAASKRKIFVVVVHIFAPVAGMRRILLTQFPALPIPLPVVGVVMLHTDDSINSKSIITHSIVTFVENLELL